ncbi:hypothetical protein BV210_18555 (plasmid) [Halorientalis sp. IM1011]|nr:hypothetical protein BV210_18555 [Halorientalis sp. IM1011]
MTACVDTEAVRHQLVQAYTRAVLPDVVAHLRVALDEFDNDGVDELVECPVCGRLGMAERIQAHDCPR